MELILRLDFETLKEIQEELYKYYPLQSSDKSHLNQEDVRKNTYHQFSVSDLNHITLDHFVLAVMMILLPSNNLQHIPFQSTIDSGLYSVHSQSHSNLHLSNQQNLMSPDPSTGNTFKEFTSPLYPHSSLNSRQSISITGIISPRRSQLSSKKAIITAAHEKLQAHFLHTVHTLQRIFDLVDIDHRGHVAWSDITNYCIRAGNFAFRGSILQSNTNFRQMDGIPSANTIIPIRRLYYCKYMNFLFATDSVQSMIRIFTTGDYGIRSSADGGNIRLHGIFHPHKEFAKKILQSADNKPKTLSGSLIFQRSKQITAYDDIFHSNKKKTIVGLTFVEKKRRICLATADRYLMTVSYKDSIDLLLKEFKPSQYEITRYQFTEHTQTGIVYSKSMDVLVTWAGEDEECRMRLWHVEELTLLETVLIHKDRILDICEVTSTVDRSFMISSDNGAKIYLWSVKLSPEIVTSTSNIAKPLTKVLPLAMQLRAEPPAITQHSSEEQILRFQLKGHKRSVKSLVFAPHSGMIIGGGFDFEIYVWDPWAKMLMMKLVGHIAAIFKVIVVNTPSEKIISIDELGGIKIWNIGRDVVGYGELLQSISLDLEGSSSKLVDMSPAFDQGLVFAVQTDRLQYFTIEDGFSHEGLTVNGGLGYCASSGALFAVTEDLLTMANIRNGKVLKRLYFADEQVSEIITSTLSDQNNQLVLKPLSVPSSPTSVLLKNKTSNSTTNILRKEFSSSENLQKVEDVGILSKVPSVTLPESMKFNTSKCVKIDPNDRITTVTFDETGKKMFLGTYHGRVFLYDSNTFGLLKDLTSYDDGYKESSGAVAALCYSQRDGILNVAYSNGIIKVYNGLFRNFHGSDMKEITTNEIRRSPPVSPLLLRSTIYPLSTDNSIFRMIFSEDTNTLVLANTFGIMWVFSYQSLILHNVLKLPMLSTSSTSTSTSSDLKLSDMVFLERLPVILVTDTSGRVTLYRTYPEEPLWIFSWNPAYCPYSSQFKIPEKNPSSATSSRPIPPPAAIESSARLTEIKTLLIDEMSIPSINGHGEGNISTKNLNIQQIVAQHSPTVSPSFVNRRSRIVSTTNTFQRNGNHSHVDVGHNTASPRKQDGNISQNMEDVKYHWYIYIINSHGRIIVQDITTLLHKAGLAVLTKNYDRNFSDMSVYNIITRLSLLDGTRQLKIFHSVQSMIQEPIGIHIHMNSIPSFDIGLRDISTISHWRIEKEGVVNNTTATVLAIHISNIIFIPTTSISEPYLIAAVSEKCDIYLWSWNGTKLLGKWQDLHTRDQIKQSEEAFHDDLSHSKDDIDPQKLNIHIGTSDISNLHPTTRMDKSHKSSSDLLEPKAGWYVAGSLLQHGRNQNIASTLSQNIGTKLGLHLNSPCSPSKDQFSGLGADWMTFLEEVQRRVHKRSNRSPESKHNFRNSFYQKEPNQFQTTKEHLESSIKTTIEPVSTNIVSNVKSTAWSTPQKSRPKTTTTRLSKSSNISNKASTLLRTSTTSTISGDSFTENKIQTDYDVWKESLKATDNMTNISSIHNINNDADNNGKNGISSSLLQEIKEMEVKQTEALYRIISESEARKMATTNALLRNNQDTSSRRSSTLGPLLAFSSPFMVRTGKDDSFSSFLSPLPGIKSSSRRPSSANLNNFSPPKEGSLSSENSPQRSPQKSTLFQIQENSPSSSPRVDKLVITTFTPETNSRTKNRPKSSSSSSSSKRPTTAPSKRSQSPISGNYNNGSHNQNRSIFGKSPNRSKNVVEIDKILELITIDESDSRWESPKRETRKGNDSWIPSPVSNHKNTNDKSSENIRSTQNLVDTIEFYNNLVDDRQPFISRRDRVQSAQG